MRSEFKLENWGSHWTLSNYKDELVYASNGPRAAIRKGRDIMIARMSAWHCDLMYRVLCGEYVGSIISRREYPDGISFTATRPRLERGDIFGTQQDI